MTEENKTGDGATRVRQGQGGKNQAACSNSVTTELLNASPAPAAPARKRPRKGRSRSKSKAPHKVLRLTTYERLDEYLRPFAKGHFHLMILVGAGGLAKSRSVARCSATARPAGSRATPPPLACTPSSTGTAISSSSSTTSMRFTPIDPVCGCSSASARPKRKRPWPGTPMPGASSVSASARVHHEEPRRHHLERLADAQQERGSNSGPRACDLLSAERSEVHAQAGKWFEDEEIYGWFAANLHRVREPSLRHYVRAKELKAAGMDWTEVLAAEEENPRARLVTEILASPAYDSTAARVAAFVQQGGGCRATFFNYRRSAGGRPRKALSSSADNRKL